MGMVAINGVERPFEEGQTILEAARAAGAAVPTLCHDPRLAPIGACRLCMVEVEGMERPVAACHTALQAGMRIRTDTPELEAGRKAVLELLAARFPAEGGYPEGEFLRWARHYGVDQAFGGASDPALRDESHPYIHVDLSRCIACLRCVRICADLQGQFVWRVFHRADATKVAASGGVPLGESECVSCGACADTCPTGAILDRALFAGARPSAWTRTTCAYCGTGCELEAGVEQGRIVAVRPAMDGVVNHGHLCVKGRYAFGYAGAADRVTEPMIREDGRWREVSWERALQWTADKLKEIAARHGANAIGVLGSARATNEENYVAQKFARAALGTNNVDCCARVCHAPTAAAMKTMLGTGAATNSFDDIERARTFLVCGANPTENHPVAGARIRRAVREGARLIVIDSRVTELAELADFHLAVIPGTDVPVLNAMAHTILEEGLADAAFLGERVTGVEEFAAAVRPWTAERAARISGVDAEKIRGAARLYATGAPAMSFHGLGITEHLQGTEGVMCLVNLALLTGSLGKPGGGVNPLRGQNNVQGSAHMGCEPSHLAGYAPLGAAIERFELAWGTPLPRSGGLTLMEMMDQAAAGRLKALWTIGYDVLLTNAHAAHTRAALGALDLLIVQDMFLNETAREFGTVFLPAASAFEKEGTFMNSERRVQRVRKAVDPPGHARPDWQIVCDVARHMGHGSLFAYDSAEQIWSEIRAVWPAGAGMSYERLDRGGLQWPCPAEDHPGTAILHQRQFSSGPRAALARVDYRPSGESVDGEYPIVLTTGRTLHQFNAGTMTMRTGNAILHPEDLLEIAPADAARLRITGGDRVKVISRHGTAEIRVEVSAGIRPGCAFATFHTAGVSLNNVTGPGRDAYTGTPEYKVTAVRIEPVEQAQLAGGLAK